MAPAYHPEWLVNFWLTAPGLNMLNPHYVLSVLAAATAIAWFLRKRKAPAETFSEEDRIFRHLLLRKKVIEKELAGLESRLSAAEITEENFNKLKLDYQSHLAEVNKELEQYT